MLSQRRGRWANIKAILGKRWDRGRCLSMLVPQQTQAVVPTLIRCWASVVDSGPTSNQR